MSNRLEISFEISPATGAIKLKLFSTLLPLSVFSVVFVTVFSVELFTTVFSLSVVCAILFAVLFTVLVDETLAVFCKLVFVFLRFSAFGKSLQIYKT